MREAVLPTLLLAALAATITVQGQRTKSSSSTTAFQLCQLGGVTALYLKSPE